MFRFPLGRKLSVRARAARRFVLVTGLFAVVAGLPLIHAGAWQPEFEEYAPRRSSSTLKGQANIIAGAEYVPGEVLVRFRSDAEAKTASAVSMPLRAEGGDANFEYFGGSDMIPGLRLAKVDPAHTLEAVAELAAREDVLYAEPNYRWRVKRTPNDPLYSQMYGMNKINAPGAWDRTTGSKSVVVGVIDEGVDVNHPDLQPNIWVNPVEGALPNGQDDDGNGLIDDNNGWDFVHNDRTVYDGPGTGPDGFPVDGHGTHVAGTIGAKGDNSIGVTGVNWDVSILSIKVIGADGGSVSNIISGYNYARQLRASGVNLRVLNNSYGGPGKSLAALDAVRLLNDAGILFVVAAGNDTRDNFISPDYPSNYDLPNVLAVAATDSGDNLSNFSNFSSRLVSIGAPGTSILSTIARTSAGQAYDTTNGYRLVSGTSMASPHVAGAAALVISASPNITMGQLRGVLAYTGDRLAVLNPITTTGRRLNVANAINAALEGDPAVPAPAGNFRITAQNGRSVTLAWTAPGDDGNSGLIADYDLVLATTAGNTIFIPLTLQPAAPGTEQSVTVNVPFRNATGTLQLRSYDNLGNNSVASVAVSVSDTVAEPYSVALSAVQPLSTDTSNNLFPAPGADDRYTTYQLPAGFTFPFYGVNRSSVTVSTNGAIYLGGTPQFNDAGSSPEGLQGQTMIAGLWDDIDLRSCMRSNSGVYVSRPETNRLIFRWQGVPFDDAFASCSTPRSTSVYVNFEIELRTDGTVLFRYGQNPQMFPTVGISGGDPDAYLVASHTRRDGFFGPMSLSLSNGQTVTFSPRLAQVFTISGSVKDANGAGVPNVSLFLSGGQSGVTMTNASGNYSFTGLTAGLSYTVSPSHPNFNFTPPSISVTNLSTDQGANFTATSNAPAGPNSIGFFLQSTYQYGEGDGRATFSVTRSGDTSGTATVDYRTIDTDTFTVGCADVTGNQGGAYARCDFATTVGKLQFAAGETIKSVNVPLVDDGHDENAETFQLQLSNATGTGTTLGTPSVATATIQDNDAANAPNPVTTSFPFFVRQQYLDFLSREPDTGGFNAWLGVLNNCPNAFTGPSVPSQCDRIYVSGEGFFRSAEFQLKGSYAFRFYKVAFGRMPEYTEIVSDMSFVAGATEQEVYARKAQLALLFTQRPEFQTAYGGMTNTQFVETLFARYGLGTVTTPDPATPDSGTRVNFTTGVFISQLDSNFLTRAQVFRAIADSDQVQAAEFNNTFVAVQYYGYLRRKPDPAGFNAWLSVLQSGNVRTMVDGFLNSVEYRLRFGQS
ncbi:MAG: serine protease [Pyrinomonadaceae bacterium]|nr:serine protease [Pyrinomonadaceae bacterium]